MDWDLSGYAIVWHYLHIRGSKHYVPEEIPDYVSYLTYDNKGVIMVLFRKKSSEGSWQDIDFCLAFDKKLSSYVVWLVYSEAKDGLKYTILERKLLASFPKENLDEAKLFCKTWLAF